MIAQHRVGKGVVGYVRADLKWAAIRALIEYDKRLRLPKRELPTELPIRYPGVVETRDVMVPMRDGVRLATNVYRSADEDGRAVEERLPAVLVRLPYGKDEPYAAMPAHGRYWARQGYVCVIQDVRGKFRSEGEWSPVVNEAGDGYDTIDWVAAQPWCDGQVGMVGESYFALTQWAAATRFHPALRCLAPGDMGLDLYRLLFEGGAFCLKTTGLWICDQAHRGYINWLRLDPGHLPLKDVPRAAGLPSHLYDLAMSNPERDELWAGYDLTDLSEKLDIPVFHWTGWYDNFLRGSLEGWLGIQERNRYDAVRHSQWLTIGPADHELTTEKTGRAGRLRLDAQGITNDRVCLFFDHWLRHGESDEFVQTPRVRAYVLGADCWREAAEWPLPGTQFTDFYLRGGGRLSRQPPAAEPPDAFDYDATTPVDYWVGRDAWAAAKTLADRRRIVARPDVLGYVTAPLAEPLEIVGPLEATLFVSTSAPDTDFTVTLVDIWLDGYAQLVQEGIRRLRFRDGAGEHAGPPAAPGEVYELRIDMAATGYEFAAGHRVGVEVSSSAFDRWDRNPNTGHAFGVDSAAELRVGHQTVYHDGARPSRIVLPLAPPPDAATTRR
jgi:putative CocE/NonD family hydrolase